MRQNAADKEQLKAKDERNAVIAALEEADLKFILSSKSGRRFVWKLLARGGMFKSVLNSSGTQVYVNAGQQDFVRRLWAECEAADQNSIFEMMREAKLGREAEAKEASGAVPEETQGE